MKKGHKGWVWQVVSVGWPVLQKRKYPMWKNEGIPYPSAGLHLCSDYILQVLLWNNRVPPPLRLPLQMACNDILVPEILSIDV